MAFFEALTLLFGESSAFVGFCRIGWDLRELAIELLWLLVSNDVDDYSQAELELLAASAKESLLGLFEVLGWDVSKDPLKDKDFGT